VLLLDGRIAGVWAHELECRRVTVKGEPFERVGASVKGAVEQEAARLAALLEAELALRWA